MTSEILKVLVVSTAHITREDQQRLEDNDFPTSMAADDYGYWLWAKVETRCLYNHGYSEDMAAIMAFALDQGCTYVRIDCDGTIYDNLKTHEW